MSNIDFETAKEMLASVAAYLDKSDHGNDHKNGHFISDELKRVLEAGFAPHFADELKIIAEGVAHRHNAHRIGCAEMLGHLVAHRLMKQRPAPETYRFDAQRGNRFTLLDAVVA